MITFEKTLSSYDAYFSYEKKLNLYDPILHNMVSERYRCADYEYEDFEDQDESGSDTESETDKEEEFSDPRVCDSDEEVLDSRFIEFGSFHSDLVPKQIKSIKPVTDGYTNKIGETTCFLATDGGSIVVDVDLFDPKVNIEEKLHKIEEETLNHTVLFEIILFAIDHHCADFGISFAKIHAPSEIKKSDRSTGSKFCNDFVFFAPDLPPSFLDSKNRITVENGIWFSAAFDPGGTGTILPCVVIVVFDLGGASTDIIFTTESHFRFVDHSSVWIVIFDPGDNRSPPSPISQSTVVKSPCVLFSGFVFCSIVPEAYLASIVRFSPGADFILSLKNETRSGFL